MSKAIIKAQGYNLANPQQLSTMAKLLHDHVVKNNLAVKISDKEYVMVEGWQFAGGLLGIVPRIVEVIDISRPEIKTPTNRPECRWQAEVEIVEIKSGKVISTGFAICSNVESKKLTFDEYAVLSMAQTRAIGKAYRNVIGWVVKMAGYEPAPAEEMLSASSTPATSEAYEKAIRAITNAKSAEELQRFKTSLKKGRGAKLYSEEQREQLFKIIDGRKENLKG